MTEVQNQPSAVEPLTSGELSPEAAKDVPPEIVAQSLGDYLRAWTVRLRAGESGVLPVIAGLVVISVVFEIITPGHKFLSADNLVNLFQQSAVYMVLAMAVIFTLLLGEIDLSIGFLGPLAGAIAIQLVEPATVNWPWWLAFAVALAFAALWGFAQGSLITRLHLPSFIVTLAGLLIANGLMLWVLLFGPFSGYPLLAGPGNNLHIFHELMWGNLDPLLSWVMMAAVVGVFGLVLWLRDTRRRRSGLVAPPPSITLAKITLMAIVGVALVLICNVNRATFGTLAGIPWVIPIVLLVFGAWTVLLERTRFGRYVYAIGGNPEAARRAGINLARMRTYGFMLCSVTAGIAGLLYVSRLDGMSSNVNGGQDTLYAVAAAVIGGTSLFGGRGRIMHGLLGGLVIGGIYNGLYLMAIDVKWQYVTTGLVLLSSLVIDSVSRRGATTGSVTHI